jgi:hypothetical protein
MQGLLLYELLSHPTHVAFRPIGAILEALEVFNKRRRERDPSPYNYCLRKPLKPLEYLMQPNKHRTRSLTVDMLLLAASPGLRDTSVESALPRLERSGYPYNIQSRTLGPRHHHISHHHHVSQALVEVRSPRGTPRRLQRERACKAHRRKHSCST